MNKILIHNIKIIDPINGIADEGSIFVSDGIIEKVNIGRISQKDIQDIAADKSNDFILIDGEGKVAMPGLVDIHVHFRDPGQEYKEDIETGALSAAAGGFTSVIMMANTLPTIDNEETLDYVIKKAEKTDINVYSTASVSKGLKGKELSDFELLAKKGAVGFTDDGIPLMDEALLKEAMIRTKKLGMPISLHEEDPALIVSSGVNAGAVAEKMGLGGASREAEYKLIERDINIGIETGAMVNIQHISSAEGVELIRKARKNHSNIHAEATPHHFTLTQEAVAIHGTLCKMNPPVREEADRMAIIEALADGTIEYIATDHAPHSKEEKGREFTKAPSGIIGLETSLSLGNTELVEKGYLTMSQLAEKMSANPAKLYNIPAGDLSVGSSADIVIFDPKKEWVVSKFHSKSSNSPFIGRTLTGKVTHTICKGKIVYSSQE